jgi:hypothetical protein
LILIISPFILVYTLNIFKLPLISVSCSLRFPPKILVYYNIILLILNILWDKAFHKNGMVIWSIFGFHVYGPAVEGVVNSIVTVLTKENIVLLNSYWNHRMNVRWVLRVILFYISFILCNYGPVILKNVLCVVPLKICWRLLWRVHITIYFVY